MKTKTDIKFNNKGFSVYIDHRVSREKSAIILIWLILWFAAGLIVLIETLINNNPSYKLLLVVWLAFWSYFCAVVVKLYRWKTLAFEKIEGNKEKWEYEKYDGIRSLKKEIKVKDILSVSVIELSGPIGRWSSDSVFFTIGHPSISIESNQQKKLQVGIKLSEKEQTLIGKTLNRFKE
jgi:hypothetical protein